MVSNVDMTTTVRMTTRVTAMTLITLINMTEVTMMTRKTMAMLPIENINVDSISKDVCVDNVNHIENKYYNDVVTEFERKFSALKEVPSLVTHITCHRHECFALALTSRTVIELQVVQNNGRHTTIHVIT